MFINGSPFSSVVLPMMVLGYLVLNYNTNYFIDNHLFNIGLWGSFQLPKTTWIPFIPGCIIFLNAFLLNRLFNRNNFSEKITWIVALLYVILMSFYHTFYILNGAIIAHFFIILSLFQLFELESNLDGRRTCFNAGFLLGIAATFHPSLIAIIPFQWFMITRIRPFVFRELVLTTLGFCTPLIYGFSLMIYQQRPINWNFFETSVDYSQKKILFFSYVGLFLLYALYGLIGYRTKVSKSSIRFRKLAAVIFICLIAGISIGLLQYLFLGKYEWFSFGMIALSMYLAFSFFQKKTELVSQILLTLLFILSIAKFYTNAILNYFNF
jgi:hypothetical protein